MTFMGRVGSGDLNALKSDGSVVNFVQVTSGRIPGCLLANNSTYYFVIGTPDALLNSQATLSSIQLQWEAAVAMTVTLEVTNMPAMLGGYVTGQGGVDVSDFDATVAWVQENPSTAIVSVSPTSGNSSTAATVTAGGSAAGSCVYQLSSLSTQRARLKCVVTTGGIVRANVHGKGAA